MPIKLKILSTMLIMNLITLGAASAVNVEGPIPFEAAGTVYKIKTPYEGKVLVGYDAIEHKILSFPGPKDIDDHIPVAIGKGYYLGKNAGIRAYSAVTNISYEEYINMSSTEFSTFTFTILSDQPYEEYYNCESVYTSKAAKQLKFTNPLEEINTFHDLYQQQQISNEEYNSKVTEINKQYEKDLVVVFKKMVETWELQTFCTQITNYSSPIKRGFFMSIWLKIRSIFS